LGSFGLFEKLHEVAREGFIIMKLVRLHGKEHARAKQKGIQHHCASKRLQMLIDATVDYMIDHLDGMAIFLGTHNEESTYNLIEHMKSKE
jgi:proline dehydrogenase